MARMQEGNSRRPNTHLGPTKGRARGEQARVSFGEHQLNNQLEEQVLLIIRIQEEVPGSGKARQKLGHSTSIWSSWS
jgi:hypothetical protein